MEQTQNIIWSGKPECPGRQVDLIVTQTQIVANNSLEKDITWEVRFPYVAIEKGKRQIEKRASV
jgi:hypothetical protein